MLFSREMLKGLAWDCDYKKKGILYEQIKVEYLDSYCRWHTEHALIFKATEGDKVTYYRTPTYRLGKTENQDSEMWEYDESVKCEQVIPIEKTTTTIEYEPVQTLQIMVDGKMEKLISLAEAAARAAGVEEGRKQQSLEDLERQVARVAISVERIAEARKEGVEQGQLIEADRAREALKSDQG